MSDIDLFSQASPFDAIKRIRDDGTEFWSARDLMPLLGYPRWQDFNPALCRAITAADAQGYDRHDLFRVNPEKSGGRPREDFHLARFACYLVAMNGDPRKPEVAAAQSYFAIRTREAEIRPVQQFEIPQSFAEALELAARQARELDSANAQIATLEPKAEVADKLLDAEGDTSVADAAKALTRAGIKVGERRLFAVLDQHMDWIYRAGDQRWRVKQTAIETGYMSVIPQSHYHPKTGVLVQDPPQPRVTPKGLQRLLREFGDVEVDHGNGLASLYAHKTPEPADRGEDAEIAGSG